MKNPAEMLVKEIASRYSESTSVLRRHHIDSCLDGQRPVAEVCSEHNLRPEDLVAELEASQAEEKRSLEEWQSVSLTDIIDHAVSCYHACMHQDLPHITRLAETAVQSGAAGHPQVAEVARVFAILRGALEEHTAKEERILFPIIRQIENISGAAWPPVADLGPPMTAMTREHDTVAAALASLHKLTNAFTPPADVCNATRCLYRELEELERGLTRHMLIEDEILFPRALALEKSLRERRQRKMLPPLRNSATR